MDVIVATIFCAVYLGMILGGIPGLAIDRTGVALLGAIALLGSGRISATEARDAVDVPTIALLFGLMIVSAQFRLSGFYAAVTRQVSRAQLSPPALLAVLIAIAGLLSSILANDIVCLAMAPVLVDGCARRHLNPIPFLLGLACGANVGSAATLIGNPQNMLIGQKLGLSFTGYLADAAVPALLGLGITWWFIRRQFAGNWARATPHMTLEATPLESWQTGKGLAVLAAVLVAFLIAPWPREVIALTAGGLLLLSRRMSSRRLLELIDWHLLVLFVGLFIVNRSLSASGILAEMLNHAGHAGIHVDRPGWLMAVTIVLSNLVSNVPAVMLLLPSASGRLGGPILALTSTLAGNLIIVGSIANIIVVDQAARLNVRIGWWEHARVGIPITLSTLTVAAAWLWIRTM